MKREILTDKISTMITKGLSAVTHTPSSSMNNYNVQHKVHHKARNLASGFTYLKIIILTKTTLSKPPIANISSSVVFQAFTIQLAEGTNLSKHNELIFLVPIESLRPK